MFVCFAILERLEADASRSRESLTPPSLNPAYKIEINHDNDDDSGDLHFNLLFELARNLSTHQTKIRKISTTKYYLICLISLLPKNVHQLTD